jgi:hypothetical protein
MMKAEWNNSLSFNRLRELLNYDSDTGVFTWRSRPSLRCRINVGEIAGCIGTFGYWRIQIDGERYLAHRLAWFWANGEMPGEEIDHIDGNPLNNRISNLRLATRSQNLANTPLSRKNTSGYRGVHFSRAACGWQARIKINQKIRHLGTFPTKEMAAAAYSLAAREAFGEFVRKA